MLDLTKDLFVHLAISAKSLKRDELENKFNPSVAILSPLEKTSYESVKPVFVKKEKSMEETIEEVVENPKIKALKKELEDVEEIFERLKESGENTDFIYRIENKISQLKRMIDQKSYL
ncbi:MAG: hypothetical protein KatS3mg002_0683 [Candidatus Woesearchaeota archaeon]|nr:MAG: hypothetical protein KatS3mg002_0683 [Candidatus Woesearchaeota archaeon]